MSSDHDTLAKQNGTSGVRKVFEKPPPLTVVPPLDSEQSDALNKSAKNLYDLVSLASSASATQQPDRVGSITDGQPETAEVYRRFTKDSWERLLFREQEELAKAHEKHKTKAQEGKLVDGQIKFDTEEGDEEKIEFDPELVDGIMLPESSLGDFPPELLGVPIEELDKHIKEKTFVVINTRFGVKHIYRYSATRSLFLLPPWNPVRKFAIMASSNPAFDMIIILTILINCAFLALTEEYPPAEFTFLAVYTVEMMFKLVARGMFLNSFTYLRVPWNWLDISVVIISYVMLIIESTQQGSNVNLSSLRTFRVFRVLKTISILPGLKTIIGALLNSLHMLAEVIVLTFFCMSVFALFALQVYMGVLRNKCVLNVDWSGIDMTSNQSVINAYYLQWIKNTDHWLLNDRGNFALCGNSTGSGLCTSQNENYTCMPHLGDNPNYGYTSFDDFGMALLSIFQLITLDFWEDLYELIIRASGPWNILFFVVVVFFGSFYLINLMLAVVAMSYDDEATTNTKLENKQQKEKEKKEKASKKKKNKGPDYFFDSKKLKMRKKNKDKDKGGDKDDKSKETKESSNKIEEETEDKNKDDIEGKKEVKKEKKEKTSPSKRKKKSAGSPKKASPKKGGKSKAGGPSKDKSKKAKPKTEEPKPETKTESSEKGEKDQSETEKEAANALKATDDAKESPKKKVLLRKATQETLASTSESVTETKNSPVDSGLGSQEDVKKQKEGKVHYEGNDEDLEEEEEEELDDGEEKDEEENRNPNEPVIIISDNKEYVDRNCPCCSRTRLYMPWIKFQNMLYEFVTDAFFDLFIIMCILVNTIMMATEHYPMTEEWTSALLISNYFFTAVFIGEAILKICAMSREYFRSGWNVFDLVVVFASIIDLGVEDMKSLSVFRTFRLFRVFKLAQSWKTMRVLLTIIFSTVSALGNLTLILIIVLFIFAVIGMQLFRGHYTPEIFGYEEDDIPRWNFEDFQHSMMMVFRILCGEWIEPLWDCMRANGSLCVAVFIPTLILGNFMVLNLFLALLLNAFATDQLKNEEAEDDSKLMQVVTRIKTLLRIKNKVEDGDGTEGEKDEQSQKDNQLESSDKDKSKTGEDDGTSPAVEGKADVAHSGSEVDSAHGSELSELSGNPKKKWLHKQDSRASLMSVDTNASQKSKKEEEKKQTTFKDDVNTAFDTKTDREKFSKFNSSEVHTTQPKAGSALDDDEEIDEALPHHLPEPPNEDDDDDDDDKPMILHDCCCEVCYKPCLTGKCDCCMCCICIPETSYGSKWHTLRDTMLAITEHKAFEGVVLFLILASSVSLCFEDIHLDDQPSLKAVLNYLNIIFAVLFTAEMVMKWFAHGYKTYFTSFWTILDFCIVLITLIDLIMGAIFPDANQIGVFRALRTLRGFRPLRTVSRWEGMKIVVNALMFAIPAIFNVLLVCMVFWLIFSITGVQLFQGKFYKCLNTTTDKRISYLTVPNKTVCLSLNQTWKNSAITFDDAGSGMLALYQVATFEGWMELMIDAIDATDIDLQPRREYNFAAYIFFVIFIIVGSFFILNLFIGVIIDNFNVLKKKYEGNYLDVFLTQNQRNYYNTLRKLVTRKPQKTIKRPKNKLQSFFFDVAVSTKFELTIVILIFLNMVSMMIEHFKQPMSVTRTLEMINIIFTTIFTLEAIIKIVGLRWHYFRRAWNVFDFIIVLLSLIGIVLADILNNVFVTPTLLRVVRIFRIGRVLRLIKAAKGVRKLLFAIIISLPALFNVATLLVLVVFIYAIIGMSVFGNVKHTGMINDLVNFETFERSMVLLFRLTTSGGWNEILEPLLIQPPYCDSNYVMHNGVKKAISGGDCGITWLAILYMVSYIFITFLIIINMYIAVILENFNQAHQQEEVGITEDDFEMFYVTWERYDPHASQYIKFEQLSDFVAELDEPLGIPKPNVIALVSFDLPIMEGEKLHCLDVLVSLVRHVLGDVEDSEAFRELKTQVELKFNETFPTRERTMVISTTMRRKKEDIAAKTLQRAWRRHKAQRAFRMVTENAMILAGRLPIPETTVPGPRDQIFGSMLSMRGSPKREQKFSVPKARPMPPPVITSDTFPA